jgi:hypothetical protein
MLLYWEDRTADRYGPQDGPPLMPPASGIPVRFFFWPSATPNSSFLREKPNPARPSLSDPPTLRWCSESSDHPCKPKLLHARATVPHISSGQPHVPGRPTPPFCCEWCPSLVGLERRTTRFQQLFRSRTRWYCSGGVGPVPEYGEVGAGTAPCTDKTSSSAGGARKNGHTCRAGMERSPANVHA